MLPSQGFTEEMAIESGGAIFPFGSYRLGVHGPDADIDAYALLPVASSPNYYAGIQKCVPSIVVWLTFREAELIPPLAGCWWPRGTSSGRHSSTASATSPPSRRSSGRTIKSPASKSVPSFLFVCLSDIPSTNAFSFSDLFSSTIFFWLCNYSLHSASPLGLLGFTFPLYFVLPIGLLRLGCVECLF